MWISLQKINQIDYRIGAHSALIKVFSTDFYKKVIMIGKCYDNNQAKSIFTFTGK